MSEFKSDLTIRLVKRFSVIHLAQYSLVITPRIPRIPIPQTATYESASSSLVISGDFNELTEYIVFYALKITFRVSLNCVLKPSSISHQDNDVLSQTKKIQVRRRLK